MHEKKLYSAYYRELGGGMLVYTALLVLAIVFGRQLADGPLKTVALTSPMIGFGLAVWAIARHMRRVDEYIRQTTLETVAIAAAITAGLTFTYGFLETAGFPRLSMFAVWPVMAGAWVAVNLVRCVARR